MGDTRFWIFILLVSLALVNVLVFSVYQQSHTEQDLATQFWEYLKSDPFKAVTISIVLPIILFLLERLFEVRKTHQDNLFEIAKIREEREEKEKQEEIAKRWEVVNETQKAYNELVSLSEELILLDMDCRDESNSEGFSRRKFVSDFIKRLSICINSWTELVNKWRHYFPNLESPAQDVKFSEEIRYLLNTLCDCLQAIALYYLKCENAKERERAKTLELDLLPILWGIQSSLYHPMISILKDSIVVYSKTTEEEHARKQIDCNLAALKAKTDSLKKIDIQYYHFFDQMENEGDRKALSEAFRKADEASDDKLKEMLDELKKQVHKANREDLLSSMQVSSSIDWIDQLADVFLWEKIIKEIESRRKLDNCKS